MRLRNFVAAAGLACAATFAQAVVIQSSMFNSGGSTWIGQFDVFNDGSLPLVESFTIYFDYGKATDLSLRSAPEWWDTIVVQPDDALQAPGFLDALQIDPSLGLSESTNLKGFSVEFQWSGSGAPGPFAFSINHPETFVSLEAGMTTIPGGGDPRDLPEPATWGLHLLGLAGLAMVRRSRRLRLAWIGTPQAPLPSTR